MTITIVTFTIGLLGGFLAQRSRLCFIGGLRDFLLIRDTGLLKGALAFFLAAWLTFPLASLAGFPVWAPAEPAGAPAAAAPLPAGVTVTPAAPAPASGLQLSRFCTKNHGGATAQLIILMTVAGLGLGAAATLSNGCPLRQHVLAAQGGGDALWWLGGFYAGAVAYHEVLLPLLTKCLI